MKANRGSITVEASIVVPIVLFSILALVYLGTLLYRQASLQSLADHTAEFGAKSWVNPTKDIATGRITGESLGDPELYWRLLDSRHEVKEQKISRYVGNRMKSGTVLRAVKQKSDVLVDIEEHVIYKLLKVQVCEDYDIPMARFLTVFGLNPQITLTAQASAVIDEPAEFIRNTDFIVDLERNLEAEYPGMGSSGGMIRGIFSKISHVINKLMG